MSNERTIECGSVEVQAVTYPTYAHVKIAQTGRNSHYVCVDADDILSVIAALTTAHARMERARYEASL